MDDLSLYSALVIDAFAIAVFVALIAWQARSFLHPAWMLLGLHLYIVTFRLWQLYTGSHPMKATFAWPVALHEVIRAGVASDVGLLSMGLGLLLARAIRDRTSRSKFWNRPETTPVSKLRMHLAAIVAMGIGIFGMLVVGRLEHSLKNTSWDTSGYLAATTSWPSWCMCLLHFLYGFPLPLLLLTAISLVVVGLTNASRFAVVIPVIFLVLTWLSRRRTKRFPLGFAVGILVAWVAWLPMKPLMKMLHNGVSLEDAASEAVRYTYMEFGKDEGSVDEQFLDMTAATMTLSDIHGAWYWGTTITPLIYSPIPRVIWPQKPRINEYQWELQVPSRNMAEVGMTAGLVAEGYMNLGYAGVCIYCLGLGMVSTLAYFKIARSHRFSPGWLLYLFYLAATAQVYRDGLISAVWFPFVYGAPIGWTAISHWIWTPGRLRREASRLARFNPVIEYER